MFLTGLTSTIKTSFKPDKKNAPDDKLILSLAAGDSQALAELYSLTDSAVYGFALSILKDHHAAEDVMQETYLRALGALERYTAGTNFTAWLVKIAKNIALNHVKKSARESPSDFTDEQEIRKYGGKETELPYIFDVAAKVLAEDEYRIVMLCQVAGYKRREVAEMLDMPIGTVTWKNNEALKKLRQHLGGEGRQ